MAALGKNRTFGKRPGTDLFGEKRNRLSKQRFGLRGSGHVPAKDVWLLIGLKYPRIGPSIIAPFKVLSGVDKRKRIRFCRMATSKCTGLSVLGCKVRRKEHVFVFPLAGLVNGEIRGLFCSCNNSLWCTLACAEALLRGLSSVCMEAI